MIVHVVLPASKPILATLTLITVVRSGTVYVAAGDHQRRQVAGSDGGHRGAAVAVQRAVDAGHGGDHGGHRATGGVVRGVPAPSSARSSSRGSRMGLKMPQPRFSTMVTAALVAVALVLFGVVEMMGRTDGPAGMTVVTVRLWDEQVAGAYRESFEDFHRRHPDIEVRTTLVSYASYFDTLRTDVLAGGADDIFWMSNSHLAEYADNDRLMAIPPSPDWEPSVVAQFTRADGCGVLQLTDAGIALFYNADLLAEAGVEPSALGEARWDPDPAHDTLRPAGAADRGRRRAPRRFGPGSSRCRVRQWGHNAANDLGHHPGTTSARLAGVQRR